MCYKYHGLFLGIITNHLGKALFQLRLKPFERLVKDKPLGFKSKRSCGGNPPAHSAAELIGIFVKAVLKPEPSQNAASARFIGNCGNIFKCGH